MIKSTQFSNPLLATHEAANAETQMYGAIEIVSTFGEPQAEYAALHKSAGMMDRPFRGVLELTGRDRLTFLNGLISNQTWDKNTKQPMPAGTTAYAFLLNLKGRIVADMTVIELGDRALVEMDATLVDDVRNVFEQYQFSEQVKFTSRIGEVHSIGLYGPAALAVLSASEASLADWQDANSAKNLAKSVDIDGISCVAWRTAPTGTDGANLIVPTPQAERIWRHLLDRFASSTELGKRSLRPVGWAAFNSCRIEAGEALFGIDFAGAAPQTAWPLKKARDAVDADDAVPGIFPAETGRLFERAVALTKCYIGQEVVARMHARKVFARQIVGIRMETDALPLAGAPIFDPGGTQIGVITSSTLSPALSNTSIALGFVKKPHFAIGTKLSIPAEGSLAPGIVVKTPFGAVGGGL